MADGNAAHGVLGLKARAAQRAFEARGMSAGKALRRALSRSADMLWDLALVTQSVEIETQDQDGVVDALGAGDLLVILDGPDGAIGLACMHREVLTGLIEVQTIQQVTQIPVDDRPLTATDAAMAAPFLDDVLQRFANTLEDNPLRACLVGYRFGAMIEDKRAVAHLLNAPGYHCFRAEVDLALGRRAGTLGLFLPIADEPGAEDALQEEGRHALAMQRLPVTLQAVLARLAMPLTEAEALRQGDLLPLSPDIVDGVELRSGQSAVVARGRLGQMNGMRALRLNWPTAPEAAQPAAQGGMAGVHGDEAFDMQDPVEDLPMADAGDAGAPAQLPDLPALESIPDADFGNTAPGLPDLPEAEASGAENDDDDPFGLGEFGAMDFDSLPP